MCDWEGEKRRGGDFSCAAKVGAAISSAPAPRARVRPIFSLNRRKTAIRRRGRKQFACQISAEKNGSLQLFRTLAMQDFRVFLPCGDSSCHVLGHLQILPP